jgi:serine/threonine protein kinase
MGYKKGETLKTAFDAYTIEGQKGAGASGEVYEVRDSEGVAYAAKILDAAKASAIRLKRFKNEIGFCTKNTHENIIRVLASGITGKGATFYVMPLYSCTLRDLISKGIAPPAVLPYFEQMLSGIGAAHLQGVWHRDLKPENILFSETTGKLVVADFGIAHFEEEELLTAVETKNDERLANFLYSAPEQRSRGQQVNSGADIYALGLILNEMFTGAVPQGSGFRKVSDAVSDYAYLDGLIESMRHQNSSYRPSIADVQRELIARGNEFVSVQRLSSLKSEVIPDTEVDDPVIRNPIQLVAPDYQDGFLVLKLSCPPPPRWIMVFKNLRGSFSYFQGAGPVSFTFNGDIARVRLGSGVPPAQLLQHARSYIELANRQYAELLVGEHRKGLAAEREQLRSRIAEEERRQKILADLKI